MTSDKIVLVCIAKNESQYIREFVEHHLNLGFDLICIYDNNDYNSDEDYNRLLANYINQNKVIINNIRSQRYNGLQMDCYLKSYNMLRQHGGFSWAFFMDVDEFLILNNTDNIHTFFENPEFRYFDEVHFNWICMSDNDLIENDRRPLMERFTTPIHIDNQEPHGYIPNKHIKCAIRVDGNKQDIQFPNPHCTTITNVCNPSGKPCEMGPFNDEADISVAYIKHFRDKTIQEFLENKMQKGFSDWGDFMIERYDFFYSQKSTVDKCQYMIRYIFKLQSEIRELKNKLNPGSN